MTAVDPPAPVKPPRERLFNLPPVTFGIVSILTIIHVLRAVSVSMNAQLTNLLAFMPAAFTAHPLEQSYTLISYAFLHFGWLHYFMNITGLMAFGSGTESLFGRKWLIVVLTGGSIVGALGHWALEPQSMILLGGISAGISALFGGLMPAMVSGRNYWTAIIVFVVTNIAIGFIGVPTQPGLAVAWQAHLFGFAFGLAATHARFRFSPRRASKIQGTQK